MTLEQEKMTIEISVRRLVEFIFREGDIDNRTAASPQDAMAEGARIHRLLQRRMGITYEPEVYLRHDIDYEKYMVHIEGRADGIIRENDTVTVDEIKTTYRNLKKIKKPETVHLAQAMCYAYFLAFEEQLASVTIRMTYCSLREEEQEDKENKAGKKNDKKKDKNNESKALVKKKNDEYINSIQISLFDAFSEDEKEQKLAEKEQKDTVKEEDNDEKKRLFEEDGITLNSNGLPLIGDMVIYENLSPLERIELLGDGQDTNGENGIENSQDDSHDNSEEYSLQIAQTDIVDERAEEETGLAEYEIEKEYWQGRHIKYFYANYTFEELKEWFEELMTQYRKWTDFEYEWRNKRQASLLNLRFPFDYRKGQEELMGHVYQTICHQKKLFIQAPTGVGKTISTIYPAVMAMGRNKAEKLFYLTAKTITRTVAEETFSLLRNNGMCMKTLTITAKEKICPLEETKCNPKDCPRAKGHYSRVNEALYDMLQNEDSLTRDVIELYATKYNVCPFEMSLDMSLFSDAIIGDYNYLFDPYAQLKRFFAEGTKMPYLFLIDEAHNLVERGRQMYSAQLSRQDFLTVKRAIKEEHTGLEKYLETAYRQLYTMINASERIREWSSTGEFDIKLSRLHTRMSQYLEEHREGEVREIILDFYFKCGRYLDVNEMIDENYITYSEKYDDGDFIMKQFCVNPASRLKACMDLGVTSILFSATFLPIQYYKRILGGQKDDFEVYAKTTFEASQMKLIIGKDVTTKYTRRCREEYEKIAQYIAQIVAGKDGNYMVFCPSHLFLSNLYEVYMELFDAENQECVLQQEKMDEKSREDFLNLFVEQRSGKSIIGFCVLGGLFSEGIDLKGEALIGTIVVGTGLPQVCPERELVKTYFDDLGENGFNYAYRNPGMNKVLQAAGRVIRTADDHGVIALLDERFLQNEYLRMFPTEWAKYEIVSRGKCRKNIEQFWQSKKE